MRVIAGPNGSGKTTILSELDPSWIGVWVNADEIEAGLKRGPFDLQVNYGIQAADDLYSRLHAALAAHGLAGRGDFQTILRQLHLDGATLVLPSSLVNSYFAAALADFVRRELLAAGESFTFETVMSSPDKVGFMREAQLAGYRTYLYFVATDDPQINVDRVQLRVQQGGHPVKESDIRGRYQRSIALLSDACGAANRAYVFDNSGEQHRLIAQVVDGDEMRVESDDIPAWFADTEVYRGFQA